MGDGVGGEFVGGRRNGEAPICVDIQCDIALPG
jgi:hypothetical protein